VGGSPFLPFPSSSSLPLPLEVGPHIVARMSLQQVRVEHGSQTLFAVDIVDTHACVYNMQAFLKSEGSKAGEA